MFVYNSSTVYLCYVEKCNIPTPRFNMHKADINQLNSLFYSVEWDEALRDFDINSAWTYFSSKSSSFFKRIHYHVNPKKKEKSAHHS